MSDIQFVEDLPKINRGERSSGVWAERIAPLREYPGKWAKVFGPTKNPHAMVNNVRGGKAAGVDPTEFKFSGRMVEVDEDGVADLGNIQVDVPEDAITDDGKTGFVFAMCVIGIEADEPEDTETEDELVDA